MTLPERIARKPTGWSKKGDREVGVIAGKLFLGLELRKKNSSREERQFNQSPNRSTTSLGRLQPVISVQFMTRFLCYLSALLLSGCMGDVTCDGDHESVISAKSLSTERLARLYRGVVNDTMLVNWIREGHSNLDYPK